MTTVRPTEPPVLEIERNIFPSLLKLAIGVFFLAVAPFIVIGAHGDEVLPAFVMGAVPVGIAGSLLAASNLWKLVRRPLALRATEAGLWFGRGPIVPWREVTAIYEASGTLHGEDPKQAGVAFAFRRKRMVLRLPIDCWITTIHLGDVRLSLHRRPEPAITTIAKLEAMRTAACGTEDGVVSGSVEPPAARVVRR